MWAPFSRSFPGNEAHKFFFSGGPKWGFWVGAKKFMLKKVYVQLSVRYSFEPLPRVFTLCEVL